MVKAGDGDAADVVVVECPAADGGGLGWIWTSGHERLQGAELWRHSQNLQRPQSPEGSLLNAADVVLVQLTGGANTNSRMRI